MATTVSTPVIGIVRIDRYQVRVQVRPGGRTAWLTLLGRNDFESLTVGTICDLNGEAPQLRVFQRVQRWATPPIQRQLIAAVTRLYREYLTTRPVGS